MFITRVNTIITRVAINRTTPYPKIVLHYTPYILSREDYDGQ